MAAAVRSRLHILSRLCPPLSSSTRFYAAAAAKSSSSPARTKKRVSPPPLEADTDPEEEEGIPTSGISRPLSETLKELNKKLPDSLVRTRVEDGFTMKYVPWHIINRILNIHAPEWSGEIRSIVYSPDGKSVSVVYRLTLYGTDAEIYRKQVELLQLMIQAMVILSRKQSLWLLDELVHALGLDFIFTMKICLKHMAFILEMRFCLSKALH